MSFADWFRNSIERYKTVPAPQATRANVRTFREGVHSRLGIKPTDTVDGGTNVFALDDWDILCVLDALRPDVFQAVSREYAWIPTQDVTTYRSVGGYSLHWLEDTFIDEYRDEMARTGLVAWNPYTITAEADHEAILGAFKPVHEYGWNNHYGAVPPSEITDAGLDMWPDVDRLILWYMQPHAPYRSLLDEVERLNDEQILNEDNNRLTVWNLIRSGEVSRYEAILAYADNLRWALDDIERVVDAVGDEATVQITGDHGELFGEEGLYGHPKHHYVDEQLQVPLASTEPERVGEPVDYIELAERGGIADDPQNPTAKEQLAALGYT